MLPCWGTHGDRVTLRGQILLYLYIPKPLPITSHSLTLSLPALTLTVADKATKEVLGTFQLPVRHLQPFQPHRCRLVLVGTALPLRPAAYSCSQLGFFTPGL